MWGPSIVGFGDMRYRTADGAENAWFCAGFSPRKKDLTLYLMGGVMGRPELKRLGKFSTGRPASTSSASPTSSDVLSGPEGGALSAGRLRFPSPTL